MQCDDVNAMSHQRRCNITDVDSTLPGPLGTVLPVLTTISTTRCENVPSDLCVKRRLKSVRASQQFVKISLRLYNLNLCLAFLSEGLWFNVAANLSLTSPYVIDWIADNGIYYKISNYRFMVKIECQK